ncbi:MAG: signal peptidase II [Planctomycetota bacterium]
MGPADGTPRRIESPGRGPATVLLARRSPGAWLWLLAVIVFGVITDLWSKSAAFERLAPVPVAIDRAAVIASDRLAELIPPHDPTVAIPGVLNFTLVLNPGAVFGIGAGKRWIFVIFTVGAVAFALWMFAAWTSARDRIAHAGIGLLIAGGVGNLYDRLQFACVRDFIHPLPGMQLPFGISWPNGSTDVWPYVSNVADLWLIVGIGALLVVSWTAPKTDANGAAVQSADAVPPPKQS